MYFKNSKFKQMTDIKQEHMQLSKFTSTNLDIIFIYRSQLGDYKELNQNIELLTDREKPLLVIGDFNFCYLQEAFNPTKLYLTQNDFSQLIMEPTHIEGHLLDQAYLRDINGDLEYKVELQCKYYTDHRGLAIIINTAKEKSNKKRKLAKEVANRLKKRRK